MSAEARPMPRRRAPFPVLIAVLVISFVTAVHAAVWTPVAPMNLLRAAHGAAGLNGKLYAIGGDNGGNAYTNTAEVYDPGTNTWTNIAPMPNPKGEMGLVALGGKVYAIGGNTSGVASSVFAYNPVANSWSNVAPLNLARYAVVAAVSGGKIYAIGGWNGSVRSAVEVYDPATNTWSFVASMNQARQGHSTATGPDGRIYAMGGHPAEGTGPTAEVYDPATNTWNFIPNMNLTRYAGAATAGNDGKIYMLGGTQGGGAYTNTVEAYNPATNTWSFVAPMSISRYYLGAALVGEKIYALGGANPNGITKSVEVYDAPDVTPPACQMNPVAPNAVATQVYVPITASDSGRGIASVKLTSRSSNCRLECYRDAAYTQSLGNVNTVGGTLNLAPPEPVVYIKALKNSGSRSRVELLISDGSLTTLCDPVIAELKIPRGERRISRSFKGIPDFEHFITVQNTNPGLSSITITVNGRLAGRGKISTGETRTLNVAPLMGAGKNNRVQVTAVGAPGAKAVLVIADAPQNGSEHPHSPVNQEFAP